MSEGKKKPIVLILVIAILAVVGVGVYFGYTMLIKPSGTKEEIKYVEKELVEKSLQLEEFTLNLADEGGKSFIQTKLTLAYPDKNKDLDTEINSKLNKIQDIINTTIRQKKSTDFDGKGLDVVKKEILNKINEDLVNGRLTNIYVNKIVIQR